VFDYEELYTLPNAKASRRWEEQLVFHTHALQEIKVTAVVKFICKTTVELKRQRIPVG